jgi:hypothetical protein
LIQLDNVLAEQPDLAQSLGLKAGRAAGTDHDKKAILRLFEMGNAVLENPFSPKPVCVQQVVFYQVPRSTRIAPQPAEPVGDVTLW